VRDGLLHRRVTTEVDRLRRDWRPSLLWSLRITVAATASYVVALLLFPGTQPLLAPLTAMLVVQVTPVTLLTSGVDRVVAVVAGVALAVGFAAVVPLEWWSLAVLIAVSITIGQLLRLRSNMIEVAISGMLVLGVGSLGAESAAWQRITETLVGAAVGIAANLLFPPKVASADAGRAMDALADSVSGLLVHAADQLAELLERDAEDEKGDHLAADLHGLSERWLDEVRTINHDIPNVGAALIRAEQGRRLNVRAVGTPDVGPGLRQGLEALEHSVVTLRNMFRAVADASLDEAWLREDTAADVLAGLAQTFRELGAGVDAFGELVRDDADRGHRARPGTDETDDVDRLRTALEGLHEARARLEHALFSDLGPTLLELHAAVLATVRRVLREMDLDERIRRQVRLTRRTRPHLPGLSRPAGPPAEVTADADTQLLPRLPGGRRPRR
jgi:hypothetical protein